MAGTCTTQSTKDCDCAAPAGAAPQGLKIASFVRQQAAKCLGLNAAEAKLLHIERENLGQPNMPMGGYKAGEYYIATQLKGGQIENRLYYSKEGQYITRLTSDGDPATKNVLTHRNENSTITAFEIAAGMKSRPAFMHQVNPVYDEALKPKAGPQHQDINAREYFNFPIYGVGSTGLTLKKQFHHTVFGSDEQHVLNGFGPGPNFAVFNDARDAKTGKILSQTGELHYAGGGNNTVYAPGVEFRGGKFYLPKADEGTKDSLATLRKHIPKALLGN